MSRPLRAVAAIAALVLAVTAAPSAAAQNRTVSDPAGDTTAPNDVIEVAVRNTGTRVVATATYRDLRRGHVGASFDVDPGPRGGPIYSLMRYQDFDGRWKVTLWKVRRGTRILMRKVRCPGKRATADYAGDAIVFRLPHSCTGRGTRPARDHVQVVGGVQEGGGIPREFAPSRPLTLRRG